MKISEWKTIQNVKKHKFSKTLIKMENLQIKNDSKYCILLYDFIVHLSGKLSLAHQHSRTTTYI